MLNDLTTLYNSEVITSKIQLIKQVEKNQYFLTNSIKGILLWENIIIIIIASFSQWLGNT